MGKVVEKYKPPCELIGKNGNVFNLMGLAKQALIEAEMSEEAKQMIKEVTSCGSYNEALTIIGEYVEIQ